jgi:hypothetical protein
VQYLPRINISKATEGWRVVLAADPSVIPDANLFLKRDYIFAGNMKYNTFEQQLRFVETSTLAILAWLGIEWTG